VIYIAATGDAIIELRADGFRNDVEQQVTVLMEMGFREVN